MNNNSDILIDCPERLIAKVAICVTYLSFQIFVIYLVFQFGIFRLSECIIWCVVLNRMLYLQFEISADIVIYEDGILVRGPLKKRFVNWADISKISLFPLQTRIYTKRISFFPSLTISFWRKHYEEVNQILSRKVPSKIGNSF